MSGHWWRHAAGTRTSRWSCPAGPSSSRRSSGTEELPRVEHFGFAEATDAAIMRFTREYGLEPPTFPALNPEFSNPLYLKLTCEALHTLGATRFRFGTAA